MAELKIKLLKSPIARLPRQRDTLWSLGLRRIGMECVVPDNASVRGMIAKVAHMIEMVEVKKAGSAR